MEKVKQDSTDSCPIFCPPLWKQRRIFVLKQLIEAEAKHVFDLGCGESSLLQILINKGCFTNIGGCDIDTQSIELAIKECQPNEVDHSLLRELPLQVDLYKGSIDAFDSRLLEYDAMTMIEVIEHLHSPVLNNFPRIVFGLYQPRLVIISTPNAEFNILFPDLFYGSPNAKFRHDDHKFEWTRQEFKSWCDLICTEFTNYSYELYGVGESLENPHVGYCTQIAVFKRKSTEKFLLPLQFHSCIQSLDQVASITYPYFQENHFTNQDILTEIIEECKTRIIVRQLKSDSNRHVIALDELWSILRLRQLCKYKSRLVDVLRESSSTILLNGDNVECVFDSKELLEDKIYFEDEDDDFSSLDESMEIDKISVERNGDIEDVKWDGEFKAFVSPDGW